MCDERTHAAIANSFLQIILLGFFIDIVVIIVVKRYQEICIGLLSGAQIIHTGHAQDVIDERKNGKGKEREREKKK